MADEGKAVPTWKIILAFVLDLFTSFFVFGYIIASVTGNTTDGGFQLNGGPALLLFALVIVYFVVGHKFAGGTIWQRILGAKRSI